LIRKFYAGSVEPMGERSIRAICSTGDIDMTGEVVEQNGLDLAVYNRNPIVLFGHNQEHPIGTASAHVEDGKLVADIEFAAVGLSKKADEVCALVKSGVLKSISIGFDPTETEPMDPKRPRGPLRYKRAILVEISVVSCPANTNAVITDKSYEDANPKETPMAKRTVAKTAPKLQFKDLYQVGCFARLMAQIGWAHAESVWEEACEEDDASVVPAKLAELVHLAGEALIAMTAEEVSECLACVDDRMGVVTEGLAVIDVPQDNSVVEMSAASLVRKFRAGVLVEKSGRKISAATAEKLQDAMDSHDTAAKAMRAHTKCMKSLKEIMPEEGSGGDENTDETQSTGSDGEGGEKPDKGVDNLVAKEQRIRRAKALALRAA
jgi:HK97 family phage prohead protease